MNPKQAAGRIGCSVRQVYVLLDSGELAGRDLSRESARRRYWDIPERALEEFLRRRETGFLRTERTGRIERGLGAGGRAIFAEVDAVTRDALSVSIAGGRLVLEVVRQGEHVTRIELASPDAPLRLRKALESVMGG